jgi:hypothetical protein
MQNIVMEEVSPPTTQVQQAPPTEKPPEAKPIMPPKPKTPLLVILIVLILALIGATGYLAYQNYQLKQQVSQLQTTPSPTPSPDPTANWKTYKDEAVGFSLMYPSTWNYSIEQETTMSKDPYSGNTSFSGQVQFNGKEGLIILTYGDGFGGGLCSATPNAELKTLSINNLTYNLCYHKQEDGVERWFGGCGDCDSIQFTNSSFVFDAKAYPSQENTTDSILKVLSTFKFLDPKEGVETQIRNFINQYMETIISEDWEKFKDYLTQSIQEEFIETSAPIGISSYNILSIEGPNQQGQYTVTVQMLDNNGSILKQPPGTDPQILVLQEEGEWKSLTWYLFP